MPPNKQLFETGLKVAFGVAHHLGACNIDIRSGDLHEWIGDYPGPSHRMRLCCSVMKQEMKTGDTLLSQPRRGEGANLYIRYQLPR
jgi:hypothetical protein